jgi:hypothetical protein
MGNGAVPYLQPYVFHVENTLLYEMVDIEHNYPKYLTKWSTKLDPNQVSQLSFLLHPSSPFLISSTTTAGVL